MKLHNNQLKLLRHLCRYSLLSYEDCLSLLDTAGTNDRVALSYAFRPLTKNGYVSKRADGSVAILKKGRSLFPEEVPLVSAGGGMTERARLMTVSRVAMWLEGIQIPSYGERHDELQAPYFIPSACWRKIAPGILSTTRFAGTLIAGKERLAVYDIGDGKVEWQVRAEGSLFYTRYGSLQTKATGMVLICNSDRRNEIAKNIIQQTMWNRRHLLADSYAERDRPVSWSRSPIKLKANYEHVYLTTSSTLEEDLRMIFRSERMVLRQQGEAGKTQSPAQGDYEAWPNRVFVNPATDLLKFVYFFSAQKSLQQSLADPYEKTPLRHTLCCREKDIPILRSFPLVLEPEGTLTDDNLRLTKMIVKAFFEFSEHSPVGNTPNNHLVNKRRKKKIYNMAIQVGICKWIFGDASGDKAEQLFNVLEEWAVKTYEGKSVTMGFVVDSSRTSEAGIRFKDWLAFLGDDCSAVLSDCIHSVFEVDNNCNLLGYRSISDTGVIPECKLNDRVPLRFLPIVQQFVPIKQNADMSKVGIFLLTNGDILLTKNGVTRFVKRNMHWLNLSYEAFVEEVLSHSDNLSIDDTMVINELGASDDNDNSKRILKRKVVRNLVQDNTFTLLDRKLRSELIAMDGACILDLEGNIYAFGAIIQNDSGSTGGARAAAAKKLSQYGMAVKVSTDGYIEVYINKEMVLAIK